MNFSLIEYGWKNQKVTGEVSIDVLQLLIKHNKYHETIEKLHTLIKGTPEYDALKEKLPCVKPHGVFNGYATEENFKKFSGFIFFDIDSGDMDKAREILLTKHADKICMLGRSVGGKGWFFYMKVANPSGINPANFLIVQNYLINNVFADLEIDLRAKGISRNQVIPFDPDLYVNDKAQIVIPEYLYNTNSDNYKVTGKDSEKCKVQCIKKEEERYTLDLTLSSKYIDYIMLCNTLVLQTPIEFPNGEIYITKEIDIVRVPIWCIVKSGIRHNFFKWQVNSLVYLNPEITLLEVESFVNFWNKHMTDVPLQRKDMARTVQMEFNRLKEGGENIALVKKRLVHTNPVYGNRKATANQVRAELQREATMQNMREVILKLTNDDARLTKTIVAKLTGISRQTVTRYWDEVLNDLDANVIIPQAHNSAEVETACKDKACSPEAFIASVSAHEIAVNLPPAA